MSVVVVAAAFALAACSGGSEAPTSSRSSSSTTATVPGPSTSLTPEQQAAEEAKAALLSYHEVVDSVYQAGGQDPQMRLATVATGDQLDFLMQDARRLRQHHWRQVGSSSIKNIRVESINQSAAPQVKLNFCLDATKTDGVDSKGRSIRKPGALASFQSLVTLTKRPSKAWLVSEESDKPVKAC